MYNGNQNYTATVNYAGNQNYGPYVNNPMMGFGMPMGQGIYNGLFTYSGNAISFQTRMESLSDADSISIRQGSVNITGTQVSELNTWCLVCTIIWGSIFIFPLCFMCCDWWMKRTYPSFDVPLATYESMRSLLRTPIQNLTLVVIDNLFNQTKAQSLFNLISTSQLRSFTFINNAGHFDAQDHEYSDFEKHMRPFKNLKIATQIRWGNKLVI